MNDSTDILAQGAAASGPQQWLVLLHQIPPKPDYFRVKVRRRLQGLGALPLKNSVYVLPSREQTTEDFQWLLREIVAEGGEATLCSASLMAGTSDSDLIERFRAESDAEYAKIALEASEVTDQTQASRLRRRLAEAVRKDFFGTPRRVAAQKTVDALSAGIQRVSAVSPSEQPGVASSGSEPTGRTWVTRAGVFVDRIASAWLIRRFIDHEARFRFIPAEEVRTYRPSAGEVRFDMFQGEYTHEGDRCTFETLVARFGLGSPALDAIAEIVHDIDLKDDKFSRPEAPGVESILGGIARAYPADEDRLLHGAAVFDGLFAQLG